MKNQKRFSTKRILLISLPFILATLVFIAIRFALRNPMSEEVYYSEGFYPVVANILSFFSGLLPFSLWDIFWVISLVLFFVGIFLVILRKMKLIIYGLRIAQYLALVYSFFYLLWGFNYLRPGITTRAGWEKVTADENSFRAILDSLIIHTNASYTSVAASDYDSIDKLVEESFNRNSARLEIRFPGGRRRPKTMIFSSLFAKFGVDGYFGPFFNEIHINGLLLPMEYPFVLAHEKAHQFGITSESEANLVAFIICTTSADKRLQYSGYQNIMTYFLSDAHHLKSYDEYLKKISSPVMEDLKYMRRYYSKLQNRTLQRVQNAANNAYLKTNFIKSGTRNYNQVVSLVISWYHNTDSSRVKK